MSSTPPTSSSSPLLPPPSHTHSLPPHPSFDIMSTFSHPHPHPHPHSSVVLDDHTSAWAQLTASSAPSTLTSHAPPLSSLSVPHLPVPSSSASSSHVIASSVSSPSAADSDCAAEVDELLDGIDRIRIDDLWKTPCKPHPTSTHHDKIEHNASRCSSADYSQLFTAPHSHGPFTALPAPASSPPSSAAVPAAAVGSPTSQEEEGHTSSSSACGSDHVSSPIGHDDLVAIATSSPLLDDHGFHQHQQHEMDRQHHHQHQNHSHYHTPDLDFHMQQPPRHHHHHHHHSNHSSHNVQHQRQEEHEQQQHQDHNNPHHHYHHEHHQAQHHHNHTHNQQQQHQSYNLYQTEQQQSHNHTSHHSQIDTQHSHSHAHSHLPPPPPAANHDFPRMFKVLPCPTRALCEASGDTAECFYYHDPTFDRRRSNVSLYKPHMCRFVDEPGGCRKAERCPFAHNDFERRYHPDRFGKETCRDFLRGDCPRRYCTFRHHVSRKVSVALEQVDDMVDKEMLQFVLKISDERGRALCDKLLRRFGHGKKHSGWKLEGFSSCSTGNDGGSASGRDDVKVKMVAARVEAAKKKLRAAGEKKWAASLKTCSLRDMMSGVRKVAEEMRERCRADEGFAENGCEVHRLIRAVFSNTNWSCHSQDGDNPFLVTPENQNDAVSALERLVECLVQDGRLGYGGGSNNGTSSGQGHGHGKQQDEGLGGCELEVGCTGSGNGNGNGTSMRNSNQDLKKQAAIGMGNGQAAARGGGGGGGMQTSFVAKAMCGLDVKGAGGNGWWSKKASN